MHTIRVKVPEFNPGKKYLPSPEFYAMINNHWVGKVNTPKIEQPEAA